MTSDMTRVLARCAVVICMALPTVAIGAPTAVQPPASVDGVIDLREWDFEEGGPVSLNGHWEFAWGDHVDPRRADPDRQFPEMITVPGFWSEDFEERRSGCASYRLRVLLGDHPPLACKIHPARSAWTAHVNGLPVASAGVAGTTAAATTPELTSRLADLYLVSNEIELLVHVSDFSGVRGGGMATVLLGTAETLRRDWERKIALECAIFGILAVMGLYHLILFIFRRGDRSTLYFATTCMLTALYSLTLTERSFPLLLPNIPAAFVSRMALPSFYLAVAAFGTFLWALFPVLINQKVVRLVQVVAIVSSVIALVMPARIAAATLQPYRLFTVAFGCYLTFILVRALLRRTPGCGDVRHVIFGFLLLFSGAVNDMLYYNGFSRFKDLAPFALTIFVLFMASVLSARYARAFRTVEIQHGELRQYQENLEDLVEQRTHQLEEMARTDPLTGLANRRHILEVMDQELDRAKRYGGVFTVIMGDIDRFKQINDRFGHARGDQALVEVAKTITDIIRNQDQIARWGGEEFLLLLPETDLDGALVIAERLRAAIEERCSARPECTITMTLGVAVWAGSDDDIDSLIQRADNALYAGKQAGRNQVATKGVTEAP